MHLDGSFGDVQVGRDLFIELPTDQMRKDLALARGQALVIDCAGSVDGRARRGRRRPGRARAPPRRAGPRHRRVSSGNPRRRAGWRVRSPVSAPYPVTKTMGSGTSRSARATCRSRPLWSGRRTSRIDAALHIRFDGVEKIEGARVRSRLESGRLQQPRRTLPRHVVVVNDVNNAVNKGRCHRVLCA